PETPYPVIDILPEQTAITEKGGTMRLGAYEAVVGKGTRVNSLYRSGAISERHRHRYEVNPQFHKILTDKGLVFSGMSRDGRLVEFIELPHLRYFVATQAHPELKSRMEEPSPLFYGFVQACLNRKGKH
ncbi:MAG: CTP synthetase, partial [Deltaproteobacteria bacterium]